MKIDFTFIKDNEYIINRKNIKCINNTNLIFMIDKTKYKLYDNIFEKETNEDLITFDFKNKNCKILLKKENYYINLNINVIKYEKSDNILNIKYSIESEEDIINTIYIRFKRY